MTLKGYLSIDMVLYLLVDTVMRGYALKRYDNLGGVPVQ